jgi:hypothetical protein
MRIAERLKRGKLAGVAELSNPSLLTVSPDGVNQPMAPSGTEPVHAAPFLPVPKKARMTLEFSAQLNEAIEFLARKLELASKTDVIRRAISLLFFVVTRKETHHLAVVDENDKVVTRIALL